MRGKLIALAVAVVCISSLSHYGTVRAEADTPEHCFRVSDVDGGVDIDEYNDGCPKDVVIPRTIGGKPVVSIGELGGYPSLFGDRAFLVKESPR